MCLLASLETFAQEQSKADSLARIYHEPNLPDSTKLAILPELAFNEIEDLQKALAYADELISLSQKKNDKNSLRAGYAVKGSKLRRAGNLQQALDVTFKSAELSKQLNEPLYEADAYSAIADIYSTANNYTNASLYYNKAITLLRQLDEPYNLASALFNAGDELLKRNKNDSALLYFNEAEPLFKKAHHPQGVAYVLGSKGMVYAKTGNNKLAERNLQNAIDTLEKMQDYYPICDYLNSYSDVYASKGDYRSALSFANRSFDLATQYRLNEQISNAAIKLSELYEKTGNAAQSLKFLKTHITYRDNLNNVKTIQDLADLRTNFEVAQKQRELNLLNEQKRIQKNLNISLAVILLLTITLLLILWKTNHQRKKAYTVLEATLAELKQTQKQLIQSEKMASLGELTAGIAHEIQNPLNFVNNFSELSYELLDELKEATVSKLDPGDAKEAKEIMQVLSDNLKKIIEHGKRSDLIVKSMLQHSATGTGKKELTDINSLADQYLRLAYHGIRARDKDFKCSFNFHGDENLGQVNILPNDFGRVLLNLYNNAFYSVIEKKKQANAEYDPQVSVSTKKVGNKVEVSIKDNGVGIAPANIDKIFQPFFTTKPTGKGTGLGLSLSYDIITKGHGGEILVKSKEGEGAEFIVRIPLS